ncbi:MAG TPA: LPXTG cell wall anchor domain-containing protein [Anaerolineae bacterium]|nr:LPXTG cell wall anchor domain-containing protein [Anaerolineae bacterium]HMR65200.1 LPXTG cell wall anchor domain-containing protein [Anaerolineae bacterium]
MKEKLSRLFSLMLALIGAALWVSPMLANGAPVQIFLNYLPEVSNTGPTGLSGEARISIDEAWVEIKIEGMPVLQGEQYEAWVAPAEGNEMISLGKFNANAEGRVDYYTQLENLPDLDYRLFVISVEPEPDPSPAADARRSLGGYFPNPELQIVSGTATPTLGPGVTATPGAPSTLPVTGATERGLLILVAGLVVLLLGLAGIFKNRIRSPKP